MTDKKSHMIPHTRKRHPLPLPHTLSHLHKSLLSGGKREQRKQHLPLQLKNWGQGEDKEKGAVSGGRPGSLKSMEREVWVLLRDNPGLSWFLPGMMGILYINKTWDPWGRKMGLPHIPFFMSSSPEPPLRRSTESRLESFSASTGLR